jgi:hypothetical protein
MQLELSHDSRLQVPTLSHFSLCEIFYFYSGISKDLSFRILHRVDR